MIKSMTGYGKAVAEFEKKQITVEMRSVNSKQLDVNMRIPGLYREKELELRQLIAQKAERGKIDFSVSLDNQGDEKSVALNRHLVKAYFHELQTITMETGQHHVDYVGIISKLPEIWNNTRPELTEQEWLVLKHAAEKALNLFDDFRIAEGENLQHDLRQRIGNIQKLLSEIRPHEVRRTEAYKLRLEQKVKDAVGADFVDANRLEQELIYYIEKIDITEEKVRLTSHCNYFIETMQGPDNNGRKLGFISQEIGREINTIGSKANDAEMQKLVVVMKDELEKVKEQLLNIL
jgi:uncharacterized protein (TIGR00255 family)